MRENWEGEKEEKTVHKKADCISSPVRIKCALNISICKNKIEES